MSVTARFEFDSREYYRALRDVTRHTAWRWLVPVIAIGIPGVVIVLQIPSWGTVRPSVAVASAAPWILLSAFYFALLPITQKRAANRAWSMDPSVRGTQERTVGADGLQIRGAGFTQDFKWPDVIKVVETPQFFLFFYNPRCAHFLPKRALEGTATTDARAIIQSNASGRAELLG